MTLIPIIGLVALAVVLIAVSTASSRRRGSHEAVGFLAGETIQQDRGPVQSASTEGGLSPEPVAPLRQSEGRAEYRHLGPLNVTRDPEAIGVARRQFLNRGIVSAFALGLSGLGSASLAFLWPLPSSGFGTKINLGSLFDIKAAVARGEGFHYVPEGRLWVTEYPASALGAAQSSYGFFEQVELGLRAGVTALYQVCPHLGCRVPQCVSSQWFECPCHGSKYNRVGEKKAGPAPRGLDRFPMSVSSSGEVVVDTGVIILGPPIGVNTTGQEAEGPSCIGSAAGHA